MIEKIQIVHKDVSGSLERMPYESVGRLLMALIAYAKDEDYEEIIKEDPQAYTYFPTLQGHIDRMEEGRVKGAKNGSKGGAPIGNQNAKKTSKNNLKQPKTTKNKQKQTPNLTLPNLTDTNNKKTYGVCENVLLTDEEHQKIVSAGYTELIDELSLYIDSKGAKYKSHYSTILAWARRREKESKVVSMSGQNAKNQFNRYKQRDNYDFNELERKLIRN